MADRLKISGDEARRIALAAQGFTRRRPTGRVDRRHLRTVLDDIGLLQIDSVNVLVRSQELPLFARLGPHPRTLIPDATERGDLFEYWVHEASHVPTSTYHLHRWRMGRDHQWQGVRRLTQRRPGFIEQVVEFVREQGPIVSSDLRERRGPKGSWWDWDDGKLALEHLFHAGVVSATRRRNDFARVYDLTERVIPAEVLARPVPAEPDARKELLVLAARSLGVGTFGDLTDYHRQKSAVCKPLVRELVEEGRLVPVEVDGWSQAAYMHPAAKMPRRVTARALLSPFDSVIWNRARTERLFGFHYRIEIYVPEPKRQYGYYVLPFLLGDELVGRVDLKADRARGSLIVRSAWGEVGVPDDEVVAELAEELEEMASWLALERIEVSPRGDLSRALATQPGVVRAPT